MWLWDMTIIAGFFLPPTKERRGGGWGGGGVSAVANYLHMYLRNKLFTSGGNNSKVRGPTSVGKKCAIGSIAYSEILQLIYQKTISGFWYRLEQVYIRAYEWWNFT